MPTPPSPKSTETLPTLELLFQRSAPASLPLGPDLERFHGGGLSLGTPLVYANFVESVDGVVALGPGDAEVGAGESGHIISGDNAADRFVMGLLRACADVVVVGAGTFRKAQGEKWRARDIYPQCAPSFTALRNTLGLRPDPPLVIITDSGDLDTTQPALENSLVATTPTGADRLRDRLPPSARLLVFEAGAVSLPGLLSRLRADGLPRVLVEGGPHLLGAFTAAGLLDELFLTQSPALFGRQPSDGRKGLVEGTHLPNTRLTLLEVRRHDSHLFLRYRASSESRL